MNDPVNANTPFDPGASGERLAAYLTGDMPAAERAAFEAAMAGDPALAGEVEEARHALDAAREWLALDPPGIERADGLAVPALPVGP